MEEEKSKFVRKIGRVLYVVNVRPAEGARESYDSKLREMICSRMSWDIAELQKDGEEEK